MAVRILMTRVDLQAREVLDRGRAELGVVCGGLATGFVPGLASAAALLLEIVLRRLGRCVFLIASGLRRA